MNTQPIEKLVRSPDGTLDVHSLFYTIQGEGPLCGRPAIFLRLAGCNLQCPGCDTDYTSKRERRSVAILRQRIEALREEEEYEDTPKPAIVITGGEPFRQNIHYLVKALINEGYVVQIETNGTLAPPDDFPEQAIIVVSPKTGKVHPEIARRAAAYKYVVKDGQICNDGLPARALEHSCSPVVAKPHEGYNGPIFIQPMDEGNNVQTRRNTQAAIRSVMRHGYTLQIQVHKVIGVD